MAQESGILPNLHPFNSSRKLFEAHEKIILEHRRFKEHQIEEAAQRAHAAQQVRAAATRLVRQTVVKS